MPIQSGDIKLFASQVMDDVAEGGGGPTSIVIRDGVSNDVFQDLSEVARTGGRTYMRKLFLGVDTDNTERYLDANIILSDPPADPRVSVTLYSTKETFDRRDEIAVMKMVGATNGFIRWPFVYEGLLLGALSAVIAFGLQWLLYMAVAKGIASSDSLQILHVVPFTDIWYFVALVFLGAGVLVGVGGSLTAIRKFLRV